MTSAGRGTAKDGVAFVDGLLEDVRKPFGHLLKEAPDAAGLLLEHCEAAGEPLELAGGDAAVAVPRHLPAASRDGLICRILGCCDAVAKELSHQEVDLWNAFVGADASLRGSLRVGDTDLGGIVKGVTNCPETLDSSVRFLQECATDEGELDFADLLEWFQHVRLHMDEKLAWNATSLRAGLTQLLNFAASEAPNPPGLREDLIGELRERCASADGFRLAEAAVAYQRSLVLTSCWCCEQHLREMLAPMMASSGGSSGAGAAAPGGGSSRMRQPAVISSLLAVLRAIHSELAPAERVLWELLGCHDGNFDGALLKEEATAAVVELSGFTNGRHTAASEAEFEELQRLRGDCQHQSLDGLLSTECARRRGVVNLADVLRWWWDMPEAYRVAAGLSVPVAMLRKTIHKQPEEMFKLQLRRVAADVAATKVSLRGHVRVFAELRTLSARRAIEGLRVGSSGDAEGASSAAKASDQSAEHPHGTM